MRAIRIRTFVSSGLLLLVFGAAPAAQNRPAFLAEGGTGTNLNGGGYAHRVSAGVVASPYLEFLISAECIHIPTSVRQFENGFSVTRNGTTSFISGEVRVPILPSRRITPFALAGVGRGKARGNVNEHFPNPTTWEAGLLFIGGGVRGQIAGPLSLFAETRVMLQVDSSDGIYGFVPLRGGVSLRF